MSSFEVRENTFSPSNATSTRSIVSVWAMTLMGLSIWGLVDCYCGCVSGCLVYSSLVSDCFYCLVYGSFCSLVYGCFYYSLVGYLLLSLFSPFFYYYYFTLFLSHL